MLLLASSIPPCFGIPSPSLRLENAVHRSRDHARVNWSPVRPTYFNLCGSKGAENEFQPLQYSLPLAYNLTYDGNNSNPPHHFPLLRNFYSENHCTGRGCLGRSMDSLLYGPPYFGRGCRSCGPDPIPERPSPRKVHLSVCSAAPYHVCLGLPLLTTMKFPSTVVATMQPRANKWAVPKKKGKEKTDHEHKTRQSHNQFDFSLLFDP
jgi:hypothetical protein